MQAEKLLIPFAELSTFQIRIFSSSETKRTSGDPLVAKGPDFQGLWGFSKTYLWIVFGFWALFTKDKLVAGLLDIFGTIQIPAWVTRPERLKGVNFTKYKSLIPFPSGCWPGSQCVGETED